MTVVIVGNVIDGVRLVGPFDLCDDAIEWASNNAGDIWVLADLIQPTEE
jgi:hypothetical protein